MTFSTHGRKGFIKKQATMFILLFCIPFYVVWSQVVSRPSCSQLVVAFSLFCVRCHCSHTNNVRWTRGTGHRSIVHHCIVVHMCLLTTKLLLGTDWLGLFRIESITIHRYALLTDSVILYTIMSTRAWQPFRCSRPHSRKIRSVPHRTQIKHYK